MLKIENFEVLGWEHAIRGWWLYFGGNKNG